MKPDNGTATKEEALDTVELAPEPGFVPVPPALAAALRQYIEAKRQADRDFDVAHQTTCAALGLVPGAWPSVQVEDDGTVSLVKAG